jgi:hypothetical protein
MPFPFSLSGGMGARIDAVAVECDITLHHDPNHVQACQRKVEMSYSLQNKNVRFGTGGARGRDSLGLPVKRRRAMLASNPIEE